MGLWDRQKDWKEIDEKKGRHRNTSNRVLPQLKNLKVAPKEQGFFEKLKLYIKNLFKFI